MSKLSDLDITLQEKSVSPVEDSAVVRTTEYLWDGERYVIAGTTFKLIDMNEIDAYLDRAIRAYGSTACLMITYTIAGHIDCINYVDHMDIVERTDVIYPAEL